MHAIVTPDEMRAVDAAASTVGVSVLIERAGWAVARSAMALLGGTYGRRVTVLAGPGNNGADGIVAARILRVRGVRVHVIRIDRSSPPPVSIPGCDLVIDAVFGTGFRGDFVAPHVGSIPVLAVDIASGVDGLTGLVGRESRPFICTHTVTFAALKPGLLLGDGPTFSATIEVADIGLPVVASAHLVNEATVRLRLPQRSRSAHKWNTAVAVIGGSVGMMGAPSLAARAAMRTGSGMVRLGIPGDPHPSAGPRGPEVVGYSLPERNWSVPALEMTSRCGALVIGPGLARTDATIINVRALLEELPELPTVVDADALRAFTGWRIADRDRSASVILTPHDGEYRAITGHDVPADRIAATRELARSTNAIVLMKGPATVVADQSGRVEVIANGDSRLATAGAGDVLSGIIGALIAQGLDPFEAAATGAYIHAGASLLGPRHGLIASDIIDHLPDWMGVNCALCW